VAEAQDLFAPAYQVSEAAGKLFGYGGIVGVSQTVTAAAAGRFCREIGWTAECCSVWLGN
jgi:hypothetical protein